MAEKKGRPISKSLRYIDPDFYIEKLLLKIHGSFEKKPPLKWRVVDWTVTLIVYLAVAYVLYTLLGFALGTSEPLVVVTSGSMEPVLYRGDLLVIQGVAPGDLKGKEITLDISGIDKKYLREFATPNYVEDCEFIVGSGHIKPLCDIESITFKEGVDHPVTTPMTTEGDVVVYKTQYTDEEIIHRVVVKAITPEGIYLITKGDNNESIDQEALLVVNKYGALETPYTITPFLIKADTIQGKSVLRVPYIGYLKLLVFGR